MIYKGSSVKTIDFLGDLQSSVDMSQPFKDDDTDDQIISLFFYNFSQFLMNLDLQNIDVMVNEFSKFRTRKYFTEFEENNLPYLLMHTITTQDDPILLLRLYEFIKNLFIQNFNYCIILIDSDFIGISWNVFNEVSCLDCQIHVLKCITLIARHSFELRDIILRVFTCQSMIGSIIQHGERKELIPEIFLLFNTYLEQPCQEETYCQIIDIVIKLIPFANKVNASSFVFTFYMLSQNGKVFSEYYKKCPALSHFLNSFKNFQKNDLPIDLYILSCVYENLPLLDEDLFVRVCKFLYDENDESILLHASELLCEFFKKEESQINTNYILGIIERLVSIEKSHRTVTKISASLTLITILIRFPEFIDKIPPQELMELLIDMLEIENTNVTYSAIYLLLQILDQENKIGESEMFDLFMSLDGMDNVLSLAEGENEEIAEYAKSILIFTSQEKIVYFDE